ncbi:MAG: tRNA preQ1(34) S-adenosylmethionine ribosyltransferase-isomerase QueA [Vulcanimicrobiaceae bacterium]
MPTDDSLSQAYRFDLPPELIAQSHAHPRDTSRLLVMRGAALQHAKFFDLPQFLRSGDLLVLNETKVFAARLSGQRHGSGGKVEVLLLRPAASRRYDPSALEWLALARPARKLRAGDRIDFPGGAYARISGIQEDGLRSIAFTLEGSFEDFLQSAGRLALPPYITNESQQAQDDYQTVFARTPGSVAAPTASLHFTPQVLRSLQEAGVEIAHLCLDVGLGTFRPMKADRLTDHHMHEESFAIPTQTVAAIAHARAAGRRVVAAGTTVMRALEGSALQRGQVSAGEDVTAIFIKPGFAFKVVDALITNFHLPQSTLLVLVSAFAGREAVLSAYREAIRLRYRFFSFGDAMLIERG